MKNRYKTNSFKVKSYQDKKHKVKNISNVIKGREGGGRRCEKREGVKIYNKCIKMEIYENVL